MDWNDLRIFLAVAEVGSLAGAARRLRLSHATAWRRIGALERALQVALFERRAGGYVLTPAGLRFLEGISGVERTVDAACRQLTQAAAVAEGEVCASPRPNSSARCWPTGSAGCSSATRGWCWSC